MVVGQEIGITVNVDIFITGRSTVASRIVGRIQAIVVTHEQCVCSVKIENDSTVTTGEVLIGRVIRNRHAYGIAVGENRTLCNFRVCTDIITVFKGFINTHEAYKATGTQIISASRGGNITGSKAVGITSTVAAAHKAAGTHTGAAAVRQLHMHAKQFEKSADPLSFVSFVNTTAGRHHITAGVAVVEVGQLGVADKSTDAVGIAEVLVISAAHVAADGNCSKALGECQHGLVIGQFTIHGTVGLGVAHQAAHGTLSADAVPCLVVILTEFRLAHQVCLIAPGILINISTAVGNQGIKAANAHQCTSSRVIVHCNLNGTDRENTNVRVVTHDCFGSIIERMTLDDRIDHVQIVNRCVHIAKQTGKIVIHNLIHAGGIESTGCRYLIIRRIRNTRYIIGHSIFVGINI